MSLGVMCGRFGLPIPRQLPIWTVAGEPIEVKAMSRSDPDFQKVVVQTHVKFVHAIEQLYKTHRGQYWDPQLGTTWAARPLHVL